MYKNIKKYYITHINDEALPLGQYCVTEFGRVLSRDPKSKFGIGFRELKGFPDGRRGYLKVKLYNIDHKPKTVSIHRLVYTTINKVRYDSKGTINHIDGNILNNCIDNLELISNKENIRHSINNKLSDFRAHMLTVESGAKVYLEALDNKNKGLPVAYTARSVGYDSKVIKQLLTHKHTLSKDIDRYLANKRHKLNCC